MLLVISPAKNLDMESPLPALKASQPMMLDHSQELIETLKKLSPHKVSSLMSISDKLGQLNYDRFQQWSRPFNKTNARPSALAFNGDVYQGLQAENFDADDFKFAQNHLRILSGLYGCLRPLDLMQAYRLEMGTKFSTARGKDLYGFWGELITEHLNKQLKKLASQSLVNLASNEYFKSVNQKMLKAEVIEPVFKDWKNGQYKIIGFYAKKARGLMANYIIKNKVTEPRGMLGFDLGGYQYDKTLSKSTQWVFTRKEPV